MPLREFPPSPNPPRKLLTRRSPFSFPGSPIWVTEYNLNDQDLATTQQFYNDSVSYMDRLQEIERYSLFGAFRSNNANVGPNAAMLSAGGQLTDIGAWYLGRPATGVLPDSKVGSSPAPRNWGAGSAGLAFAIAVAAASAIAVF
jgi:hypothetical protein